MPQQATIMIEKSVHLTAQKFSPLHLPAVWVLSFCTLLCFAHFAHAQEAGQIVKWKDERGVTHYGDKIPPQYANRESSIINRQGVTVKYNKPVNHQDQAQDLAKLEQDKKDKALLGTFTSADEIDLARERNIQPGLLALEGLMQDQRKNQAKLTENQKLADSFTKRKKPIPADINTDIANNKEDIAKLEQRISDQKQLIETTRKRFDEDKQRYLMLKHQTASEASTPSAATIALEKPAASAAGTSKR